MSDEFPTSIGRLGLVAFDCPDALALADFYSSIVGGDLVPGDDEGWVELHTPTGKLAFQQIDDHRPPTWPDGDVPQQAHIDIDVCEPRRRRGGRAAPRRVLGPTYSRAPIGSGS